MVISKGQILVGMFNFNRNKFTAQTYSVLTNNIHLYHFFIDVFVFYLFGNISFMKMKNKLLGSLPSLLSKPIKQLIIGWVFIFLFLQICLIILWHKSLTTESLLSILYPPYNSWTDKVAHINSMFNEKFFVNFVHNQSKVNRFRLICYLFICKVWVFSLPSFNSLQWTFKKYLYSVFNGAFIFQFLFCHPHFFQTVLTHNYM